MYLFDIENIAFQILSYPISCVELIATSFGLLSVYFAARVNILTWGTGIINEVFLFFLFFQVQLYADMFLQVYFFIVTIYGWYRWGPNTSQLLISRLGSKAKITFMVFVFLGTLISGYLLSKIHVYLPMFFEKEAAFPFVDSFVMVSSILATVLLARKKIENWYLWIAIDLVCIVLYFKKGIYFLAGEYFIFLGIAIFGFYNWKKHFEND